MRRTGSSQQFGIYHDIWHYSFSDIFSDKFICISAKDGRTNIIRAPLDEWSPVLVYTNHEGPPLAKTKNLVISEYDKTQADVNKVFWYLSLSSFDDFLKRRDSISAHPSTNFPSTKTYQNMARKTDCLFRHENLDRDFFIGSYNRLNNAGHQSGEVVLDLLTRTDLLIPKEWIKTAYLVHNNEVVAIALLVDDLKSVCMVNMAAKRSNLSYGSLLITEIIKFCCDHNYYSADGGVSCKYGIYKDKLFLDSKSVIEIGDFFRNYRRSFFSYTAMKQTFHKIKHIF